MPTRRRITWLSYSFLTLLISLILLVGCNFGEAETVETVHTWLLVRAPEGPLPVGKAITVKSRTEDTENGVSHVELYVVQFTLPSNEVLDQETNLLVRSDAAPFDQTSFTAEQTFIPTSPGDYVIRVRGYNNLGEWAESEYISFRAEQPIP